MNRYRFFAITASAFVGFCSYLSAADAVPDQNWSQFRGPTADGRSDTSQVPVRWDNSQVAWTAELPVAGHSSPAVWNDRIFLTGSKADGADAERHIFCINRNTGDLIWDVAVARGPGESLHKMNSWATPTCATDGERVVAFFGPAGLHCVDVDGSPKWSRQLGEFPGAWGIGASPRIIGDLVLQNCDAQGDSFLLAVDKKTGEDVWRTPRKAKPRGGWSTPIMIPTGEVVLNGEFGIEAYDLSTGKSMWNCQSFNGRGTPAPVFGHGLIFVVNGKPGDVYAVRPGGSGDVTDSHMQWHTKRGGGRDLPSPVLADRTLVVVGMQGIVTGYDPISGKEKWKQRIGGNYAGSPIVAGGHVYIASESGKVVVFKAGDAFELVSENSVSAADDEIFRSSLAIAGDKILLRSDKRLYCIGK